MRRPDPVFRPPDGDNRHSFLLPRGEKDADILRKTAYRRLAFAFLTGIPFAPEFLHLFRRNSNFLFSGGELELRRLNLIGPGREVESLSGTAANLITLGLDGNSPHILP